MKYLQYSYTTEFWINEAIHGRDLKSLVWIPDWKNKLPQKQFGKQHLCYTKDQNLKKIEERCAESWSMIK